MPKRTTHKSTPQNPPKKQKPADDHQIETPIGWSYFELLPKEILLKIYENFSTVDLQNLMATSKTIKNFIEENFSHKFTVRFSKSDRRKIWIGSRIYRNVIFSYCIPHNFVQHFIGILRTFGSEVKSLTINCKVTQEDLVEILKICKNVEVYKYTTANYHNETDFEV